MCDFGVGEKVVCVDGKFFDGVKAIYKELPAEGRTYVVRDLRIGIALGPLLADKVRTGEVSVLLVGVTNPPQKRKPFLEPGFAAWRFVRLEEWREKQAASTGKGEEKKDEVVA